MTTVIGKWYPQQPPLLWDEESPDAYTNRLLGADPNNPRPYDHRRNRQCSIGWHGECSDRGHEGALFGDGEGCGCPCHVERLHAGRLAERWNRDHEIGTLVSFPPSAGEPDQPTTSLAWVDESGWPVVEVNTFDHPVWLSWLTPVRVQD